MADNDKKNDENTANDDASPEAEAPSDDAISSSGEETIDAEVVDENEARDDELSVAAGAMGTDDDPHMTEGEEAGTVDTEETSGDEDTGAKKSGSALPFMIVGGLAAIAVVGVIAFADRDSSPVITENGVVVSDSGERQEIMFPSNDLEGASDSIGEPRTVGGQSTSEAGTAAPADDQDEAETAGPAKEQAEDTQAAAAPEAQEESAPDDAQVAEAADDSTSEPSEEALSLVAALNAKANGQGNDEETSSDEDATQTAAAGSDDTREEAETAEAETEAEVEAAPADTAEGERLVALLAARAAEREGERAEEAEAAREAAAAEQREARRQAEEDARVAREKAEAERAAAEEEAALKAAQTKALAQRQAAEAAAAEEAERAQAEAEQQESDDNAATRRVEGLRRLAEQRAAQRRAATGEEAPEVPEEQPAEEQATAPQEEQQPATVAAVIPEERIEDLRRQLAEDVSQEVQGVRRDVLAETEEKLDTRLAETDRQIQQTTQAVTETRQAVQQTEQGLNQIGQQVQQTNQAVNETRQAVNQTQREVAATNQKIAQLEQGLVQQRQLAAQQLTQLESRIQQLQTTGIEVSRRQSLLVALTELGDNVDAGRPFRRQLNTVESITGGDTELSQLRVFADTGIPSDDTLRQRFDDAARQALAGSKRDGAEGGVLDKFAANLSGLFSVRPVGEVEGDSVGAIIARAEVRLDEGNVGEATQELRALEGEAREAFDGWIAAAEAKAIANDGLKALENMVTGTANE